MSPHKAHDLIQKLEALADPARGATPHERRAAARKAQALRHKYGTPPPPRTQPHPRTARAKAQRRPTYAAPAHGPAWTFNVMTGEHSDNVKVHHYQNKANWRIEVMD